MNLLKNVSNVFALALLLMFVLVGSAKAATNVNLGGADSFAVLGASTVTNTGSSVINGNLGLHPGTSITGFPPGIVNGVIHATDAVALQAQTDLVTAYNNAAGQTCDTDLTGQDLGGLTLTPGTYCFSSSAQLTGTLILDAQNDPNAVFIFQIGSTLTTASSSSVTMINSGQSCHVFWQVGSSATLGTSTDFMGTIMALASVTLNTGATIDGRALARTGAVTLDTNTITTSVCTSQFGTLHVVKTVVGGTAAPSLFNLHVLLSGIDVSGSPAAGAASPGTTYVLLAGDYAVSEDANTSYTRTFSGDCDSSGNVALAANDSKTCTVTNTYITPGSNGSTTADATTAPGLPDAGSVPYGKNIIWSVVVIAGIFAVSVFFYITRRKQTN